MWSQYDEDLSKNDFFKEIKHKHSDILKKAAEENWIICIPRSGSLKSEDISIKTILDHVLVPNIEPKYSTLSKKDVRLDNRHLKLEQNNIFYRDLEVLFEETHYTEGSSKYLVWCVNGSLFVHHNQVNNYTNNNVILISVQDCIDFLYSETFGHNLLKGIQKLCLEFWKSCEDCFETETLQSQKDSLGNLYSQCLQLCFKNDIISEKCHQNLVYMDSFKLSIETYMQYCLGKKLLYSINTLHHFTDCMINKIVRNSSDVSLSNLNISSDFGDLVLDAKNELSRINHFVTVLDKINCLSRTFNVLNNKSLQNDKNLYVTSDDFLQILVYLILKCEISNWTANLTFIKEFQFATSISSDQTNFLLSSLEAAIAFIKSSQFLEIKKSLSGTFIASPFFDEMYIKFKLQRNLVELNELFASANERNSTKLCHPLCLCINCKHILSQNANNGEAYKILNDSCQNFVIKASIENDADFLEFLLSLNFDIDFKDSFGKTALHYAAEMGLQDIVLLLINAEANVNILDSEKNTALHLACDRGHDNCVKAFIYSSHFVEINLQNIFGETPLFLATRWGYFDIIKILLENGASLCIKNNRNIMVYNLSPNYYITKLFRRFGSESSNSILEEVIKDKSTSFNNTSNISDNCCNKISGSFKEQSILFGVQPKTASELKKLELLLKAIIYNDLPLACFYLGYDSNSSDENLTKKCHPLCTCEQCSKANDSGDSLENSLEQNKVDTETDYKINVNMCDTEGFTPLHIAAKYGRTEILRVLLDGGAFLNIRNDKTFHTPLHLAVIYQRVQTVKELLKCGNCDVDAQDSKGNTPLYYACARNSNNMKIVELLLQNGANSQKKNFEEKTVLQMCEEKNFFGTCRMLRESMGYFVPSIKDEASRSSPSNISFESVDNNFEIL